MCFLLLRGELDKAYHLWLTRIVVNNSWNEKVDHAVGDWPSVIVYNTDFDITLSAAQTGDPQYGI